MEWNTGEIDTDRVIQLTGSLVFDEEKLEALLESVFIHIEFYLHPKKN